MNQKSEKFPFLNSYSIDIQNTLFNQGAGTTVLNWVVSYAQELYGSNLMNYWGSQIHNPISMQIYRKLLHNIEVEYSFGKWGSYDLTRVIKEFGPIEIRYDGKEVGYIDKETRLFVSTRDFSSEWRVSYDNGKIIFMSKTGQIIEKINMRYSKRMNIRGIPNPISIVMDNVRGILYQYQDGRLIIEKRINGRIGLGNGDTVSAGQAYFKVPKNRIESNGILQGMDKDKFYLGDTIDSAVTANDIKEWKRSLTGIRLKDGAKVNINIKGARKEFIVIEAERGKYFIVDNNILKSIQTDVLKGCLRSALMADGLSGLSFGNGPIIVALCKRSRNMFGDCVGNRAMFINRAFLSLYNEILEKFSDKIADNFLQLGLEHELLHELKNAGTGIEKILERRDLRRMVDLFNDEGFEIMEYLLDRGVITEEFCNMYKEAYAIDYIAHVLNNENTGRGFVMHFDSEGTLDAMGSEQDDTTLDMEAEYIKGSKRPTYWDLLKGKIIGRNDTETEVFPKGLGLKEIINRLQQIFLKVDIISKDGALLEENLSVLEEHTAELWQKKKIIISSKFFIDNVKKEKGKRFSFNQTGTGVRFILERIREGIDVRVINESGVDDLELQRLISAVFGVDIDVIGKADPVGGKENSILILHERSERMRDRNGDNILLGKNGVSTNALIAAGVYKLLGIDKMDEVLPQAKDLGYLINEMASYRRIITVTGAKSKKDYSAEDAVKAFEDRYARDGISEEVKRRMRDRDAASREAMEAV